MTLGELKEYALKLIDEYSGNANLTDDGDIKLKLNNLFNIAQIEVSLIKKIDKILEFNTSELSNEEYNTTILPIDFMELNKIRFFPSNNSILNYYIQGKNLKTKNNCLGKFEVEYYATPKTINSETNDIYEFELDLEAQMLLPYYVASDILKSDVASNYTSLEAKYNAKLEILMQSANKGNQGLITINQFVGNL